QVVTITLLAARTLPLFILQVQIKPFGQTDSCVVTRSNFKNLYWIVTQQVAHHTINGCNLRPDDLLGTGTISGVVCLVHYLSLLYPFCFICMYLPIHTQTCTSNECVYVLEISQLNQLLLASGVLSMH
ncbi:hypothetical protein E1A91_D13G176600v1, partial [Gossypium mustelinum]